MSVFHSALYQIYSVAGICFTVILILTELLTIFGLNVAGSFIGWLGRTR